jgi:hypothetical protein
VPIPKHPPGPLMDLANMRRQGVHHLIAYRLMATKVLERAK